METGRGGLQTVDLAEPAMGSLRPADPLNASVGLELVEAEDAVMIGVQAMERSVRTGGPGERGRGYGAHGQAGQSRRGDTPSQAATAVCRRRAEVLFDEVAQRLAGGAPRTLAARHERRLGLGRQADLEGLGLLGRPAEGHGASPTFRTAIFEPRGAKEKPGQTTGLKVHREETPRKGRGARRLTGCC